MKKIVSLALSAVMATGLVAGLAACNEKTYKIGMICLHGSASTYDANFINAMKEACENKGMSDDLTIVTDIPEETKCYDTAKDLVDQGCELIFADSFGHEAFIAQAAEEFPNVEFCHATGTTAQTAGLDNFHNAFASIYEGRYLAGVAGGMKLLEMYQDNELEDSNFTDATKKTIKIGYVGAWPYAEVKSGYTSWFLGVQSVFEEADLGVNVAMEVQFTNSWYDETAEKSAAQNLISRGAALISQHADSMGAPSACETAGVPNVSYNGSTATACPNTYIVSSRINWVPYFEYIIDCVFNDGGEIDTDWCGGLENGSVVLTDLGTNAAEGTAEKLATVKASLIDGSLKVFDKSKFTKDGVNLTSYTTSYGFEGECIVTENGKTYFAESSRRSAPYFDIDIDGITILTDATQE